MSRPIIYSPLSEQEKFMLYLAKHANKRRFLPFPAHYKIISPTSVTAADEPDASLDNSYSVVEYDALKHDLDKFASNPDAYPELRYYLSKLELDMTLHDKSYNLPGITEYEFRYSPLEEHIRDIKYPRRWYLFHGSALGNWHSILRNGLRNMSNTQYMSAGAAHGPGVYLSDNINISYRYGGHAHCIAVVEILTDPKPYEKSPNVYVISDDKLLVVRYLLKISKLPDSDGKSMLDYYTRLTEHRIKDNSIKNRILVEEKKLEDCNVHILEKSTPVIWNVLYEGVILRVYLHSYPFKAPIVQPVYKYASHDPKHNAPFMSLNWIPIYSIVNTLLEYKQYVFNGAPFSDMTETEIPLLT